MVYIMRPNLLESLNMTILGFDRFGLKKELNGSYEIVITKFKNIKFSK